MQPKINEVVEWQRDIRPLLTEMVTHRVVYETAWHRNNDH
jgi:hypothetical protein